MVDGWTAPSYSKDSRKFARSAVAYSRDGKHLYQVAVEGARPAAVCTSENWPNLWYRSAPGMLSTRWWGLYQSCFPDPRETAVVPVNLPAYGTPRPVPTVQGSFYSIRRQSLRPVG